MGILAKIEKHPNIAGNRRHLSSDSEQLLGREGQGWTLGLHAKEEARHERHVG